LTSDKLRPSSDDLRQDPMRKKAESPTTGVPFRSKLAPFEAHIRQWLKAGLTYREMVEKLRREHGLAVHRDTINAFVLVRSRGHRRAMLPPPVEDETTEATPAAQPATGPALKGKGKARASSSGSPPSHYQPARPEEL